MIKKETNASNEAAFSLKLMDEPEVIDVDESNVEELISKLNTNKLPQDIFLYFNSFDNPSFLILYLGLFKQETHQKYLLSHLDDHLEKLSVDSFNSVEGYFEEKLNFLTHALNITSKDAVFPYLISFIHIALETDEAKTFVTRAVELVLTDINIGLIDQPYLLELKDHFEEKFETQGDPYYAYILVQFVPLIQITNQILEGCFNYLSEQSKEENRKILSLVYKNIGFLSMAEENLMFLYQFIGVEIIQTKRVAFHLIQLDRQSETDFTFNLLCFLIDNMENALLPQNLTAFFNVLIRHQNTFQKFMLEGTDECISKLFKFYADDIVPIADFMKLTTSVVLFEGLEVKTRNIRSFIDIIWMKAIQYQEEEAIEVFLRKFNE